MMQHPTPDTMNIWANDDQGPVALTLRQKFLPVEGADAVVFPPTYAEIGYNIDPLSNGTRVATIDSVGAQANRMEPIFEDKPHAELVPQVTVAYGDGASISIFKIGHRLGDALVRSTELAEDARRAFEALDADNAGPMAKLAPTSLVFGVWDSRDTNAKRPRIVQSVIRAWDVDKLQRSAQYTPSVDYLQLGVFGEKEKEKAEQEATKKGNKNPWAQAGFVHVPATETHGGIVVHGEIRRDVTVNLIALRRLNGDNRIALRRYVLGLALVAATVPFDGFLRQGCLLTPDPKSPSEWEAVGRDGVREAVELTEQAALDFARQAASEFGVGKNREVKFDKRRAQELKKQAEKKKN